MSERVPLRHIWNSRGQHEYLLSYSFELKSAFGARLLFRCLWPNDSIRPTAKMSDEVNRKSLVGT